MNTKNRKTATAIVAGAVAVALLLGGTFAWTSISQQAKNESAGIVNVGGRLHDDFNGENKDVYVENFTDPVKGGQPIYARIRLDEYMEVGSEAGELGNPDRKAKPIVDGMDVNDESTWATHKPNAAGDPLICETGCNSASDCLLHTHWEWEMGNTSGKYYMPTFNKDKDSLAADINGTYQGTTPGDNVYYDDYKEYTAQSTITQNAYYDDDTDTVPNVHEPLAGAIAVEETHTAKQTATAEVITMAQWIADGKKAGNFWVYDTDGWAYWANPIMPGGTTGLLLDAIDMVKNPGEKCYYAINVVAQFATVGDWEYFEDGGEPSENAYELLKNASENIPSVSISTSDNLTLSRGESAEFTAAVSFGDETSSNVSWRVTDAEGNPLNTTTTIDENGKLIIGDDEINSNIIVVAESKDYPGAVALKPVTVTILQVAVTAADNVTAVEAGEALQFTATVTLNGEIQELPVTWTVSGATDSNTVIEPNTGMLTVGKNETANAVLTVTATTAAETGAFSGSTTVTVSDYPLMMRITGGSVVSPGDEVQLSAIITKNGEEQADIPVTWSVSGGDGTTISNSGLLSVNESDPGGTVLTVTAETADGASATYEVLTVLTNIPLKATTNFSPFYAYGITDSGDGTYKMWMFEVTQEFIGERNSSWEGLTINGDEFVYGDWGNAYPYVGWLHSAETISTPWRSTNRSDPHYNWYERDITEVTFLTELQPTGTAWWFYDMQGLKAVYGMDNLDMSNCTDTSFMFGGGSWGDPMALTSLDVSSWDVSKVEDFSRMFFGGENLVELTGIENWKTTSAKNMDLMFEYCGILEVDLSGWDVSNKPTHQSFAFTPNVVKNKITEPKWLE